MKLSTKKIFLSAAAAVIAIGASAQIATTSVTTIDEQPEGTIQVYSRSGGAITTSWSGSSITSQKGKLCEITTAPDGKTVYIKNPVSTVTAGTWVKGSIEGNKIHMPLLQCVAYYKNKDYGLALAWSHCEIDEDGYLDVTPDLSVTEATYTIHEDGSLTLDGAEEDESGIGSSLLSVIWTDKQNWAGYADGATKLTPLTDVANAFPEGIVLEDYVFSSTKGSNSIKVGFDANKVYIDDLAPEPVIGIIDGDKVTFTTNQYLGILGNYAVYFIAASKELVYDEDSQKESTHYIGIDSLVLDFDAATKTISASDENQTFIINVGKYEAEGDISYNCDTYGAPKFAPYVEIESAPATPYFEQVSDYTASYGQWYFKFNVPNTTEDGNLIDPSKIEWCMMTDGEIYTFSPDNKYFVSEDMEWLPYGFNDDKGGYDIRANGSSQSVYLYSGLFNEVSIQSRATFGENVYYSKICTVDLETLESRIEDNNTTGIQTLETARLETAKATKYLFDLQGRRTDNAKGLVIRNGKVTFVK